MLPAGQSVSIQHMTIDVAQGMYDLRLICLIRIEVCYGLERPST